MNQQNDRPANTGYHSVRHSHRHHNTAHRARVTASQRTTTPSQEHASRKATAEHCTGRYNRHGNKNKANENTRNKYQKTIITRRQKSMSAQHTSSRTQGACRQACSHQHIRVMRGLFTAAQRRREPAGRRRPAGPAAQRAGRPAWRAGRRAGRSAPRARCPPWARARRRHPAPAQRVPGGHAGRAAA